MITVRNSQIFMTTFSEAKLKKIGKKYHHLSVHPLFEMNHTQNYLPTHLNHHKAFLDTAVLWVIIWLISTLKMKFVYSFGILIPEPTHLTTQWHCPEDVNYDVQFHNSVKMY
jgi:hypothetical protein